MQRETDIRNRSVSLLFMSFIFGIWLFMMMPETFPFGSSDEVLRSNWICDILCFEICMCTLTYMYYRRVIDIFSPVVFLSVFYLLMFFLTPLYDISTGQISVFGVMDLFDYGVKGSLVALAGFLSFCAAYFWRYQQSRFVRQPILQTELSEEARLRLQKWLLIAWAADFAVAVAVAVFTRGFSVSYILSFGMVGETGVYEKASSSLDFIGQFTRSIVTVFLLYNFISDRVALKRILFALTSLVELFNGFRYMFVILICAYFYSYYLINKKKINLIILTAIALAGTIIISMVGYTRNSVRAGGGFSLDGFTFDELLYPIMTNLGIYKGYYAIIKAVPSMTGYLYLDVILIYTLLMVVPRAIWPEKPGNPSMKAIALGIDDYAVRAGYAYPLIGEYYYSCGTFGVIFYMGILGMWLARNAVRYRVNAQKIPDLVIYSVTVALLFQVIIRGYTPGNFYLILALYIPYWAVDWYYRKQSTLIYRSDND